MNNTFEAGSGRPNPRIIILGGGPAGMSAAYFAHLAGLPFILFEAGDSVGGNARTLRHNEFLFDTGAHRIHDVDYEVTSTIKALLGNELQEVNAPSRVYSAGRFYDFPFTPKGLLTKMKATELMRGSFGLLTEKLKPNGAKPNLNFESQSIKKYGRPIAEKFLLDYSEKLWGLPAAQLSTAISGNRLKGLGLKNMASQLFGFGSDVKHLDGKFYYPAQGIGALFMEMEKRAGKENIYCHSKITGLHVEHNIITGIEINGNRFIETSPDDIIINTLPLGLTVHMVSNHLPAEIHELARSINFRSVLLVCLFINKPAISSNASIYFADKDIPFTRAVEPKNRSAAMSPADKTSLIVEWPCNRTDEKNHQRMMNEAIQHLCAAGLLNEQDVIDTSVYSIKNAYPVLEAGYEEKVGVIINAMAKFSNLRLAGRNACFSYVHIHDLMRDAKQIIDEITANAYFKGIEYAVN